MDFYSSNLAALRRVDPQAAEWLESEPDVDWLTPISVQGRVDNFLFRRGPKKTYAYEPNDPLGGIVLDTGGRALTRRNSTLIIGMGLGYLVRKIMDLMESGHVIMVVEHTAQLVRLTFKRYDFSRAITSGALILACGKTDLVLGRISKMNIAKFTQGAGISIITEGYAELLPREYGRLKQDVLGRIHTIRGLVGANSLYGFQADLNEVMSSPRLIQSKGVAELEGLFKGYPAILVSTGPSLGRNIHYLKKAKGSALIIAAGQALRALLAYGVKPDLITYIDYMDHAVDHLAGLMTCEDVPLVCVPKVCHALVNQWQGPVLVAGPEDRNAIGCLNDLWTQKGEIRPGTSVAHFNLSLARLLKADPIIILGQDFAVGSEFTHFDQVDHRHRVGSNQDNQIVTKMDDVKAANRDLEMNRGEAYILPGFFNKQVRTFNNLLAQLNQYQSLIQDQVGLFINCTEGGARIEGTVQMRLTQALETYCRKSIPKELLQALQEKDGSSRELIRRILPLLRGELVGLKRISKKARDAMEVNRELEGFLDGFHTTTVDLDRINNLVKRNRKSSGELRTFLKKTPYLNQALFWSHGEIEKEMEQKHATGEAKTSVLVQADREFAAAALEKAGIMAQAYSKLVEMMEQYLEDLKAVQRSPENPRALIDLAETCLDMGEVREGLDLISRAAEAAPQDPEYWSALGWRGLETEQYDLVKKALEALDSIAGTRDIRDEIKGKYKEKINEMVSSAQEDIRDGFLARALVDLSRCLEAEPDNALAQDLAQQCRDGLAEKAGRADQEAELEWAAFEQESRDKKYIGLLARASQMGAGRKGSPEALDLFTAAIKVDPRRLEARWGLATTLCLMGRYEEAVPIYEGLVADFPDHPHLRLELGWLRVRQGRPDDGLDLVTPLAESIDQHPKLRTALGDLYLLTKNFERALDYYDKHLKTANRDFTVWTKRGDCLAGMGRQQPAAESYRQALLLKPGYSGALGGLGRLGALDRDSLEAISLGGQPG